MSARIYNSPLKNVFLTNGFAAHNTEYGEAVSYSNLEGLENALLKSVVLKPARLNGNEIAYLRVRIDERQQDIAEMLAVKSETVSNWERSVTSISLAEDVLFRLLVASKNFKLFKTCKSSLEIAALTKSARGSGDFKYVGQWGADGNWIFELANFSRSHSFQWVNPLVMESGHSAAPRKFVTAKIVDADFRIDAIEVLSIPAGLDPDLNYERANFVMTSLKYALRDRQERSLSLDVESNPSDFAVTRTSARLYCLEPQQIM